MNQEKERLAYLFQSFLNKTATQQEKDELAHLVESTSSKDAFLRLITEGFQNFESGEEIISPAKADTMLKQILGDDSEEKIEPTPVRFLFWRRAAIAASIILVLSLGGYLIFFQKKNEPIAVNPPKDTLAKDVSAPQTNRAMVTLADGKQVYLDEATNGQLAQLGNIKLIKLENGKIAYQTSSGEVIKELQYNTLTNPRGSKVIDMTLSDGSQVWLNAGSSVKYPIAFVGSERRVEISGEAYFEVAHDATKPFYVSKGDMQVKVLGTHFNVNAYDDENDIKVTLLEGSVHTQNLYGTVLLKPNQQASVTKNREPNISSQVDIDAVMAWKNGRFQFGEKLDIAAIMRQIARWYDVDVIYKDAIDIHFGGRMSREANLSLVLEKLELTGSVQFKREGRTVIVMNKTSK